VRQCPACSAELEVGWKFCPTCGRRVEEHDG
jgi:predicted amidophosphoribosyltransferase